MSCSLRSLMLLLRSVLIIRRLNRPWKSASPNSKPRISALKKTLRESTLRTNSSSRTTQSLTRAIPRWMLKSKASNSVSTLTRCLRRWTCRSWSFLLRTRTTWTRTLSVCSVTGTKFQRASNSEDNQCEHPPKNKRRIEFLEGINLFKRILKSGGPVASAIAGSQLLANMPTTTYYLYYYKPLK